jgi:acyl carrier protein
MVQSELATLDGVRAVLRETLQLDPSRNPLPPEAGLFGEIPEFDSMAVVNVVTALEERFNITVEDEEISAETFATVGALVQFVDKKK